MTTCTYCGKPADPDISKGAPVCLECVAEVMGGLEDGSSTMTAGRHPDSSVVIVDDLEADCPVEPGTREKVKKHYDDWMDACGGPNDGLVVLKGTAADDIIEAFRLSPDLIGHSDQPSFATAKAAAEVAGFQFHVCGPNRDDHVWDDDVEFYAAGRVVGSSVACSKCGMTAMDYDIWNAE